MVNVTYSHATENWEFKVNQPVRPIPGDRVWLEDDTGNPAMFEVLSCTLDFAEGGSNEIFCPVGDIE